MLSPRFHVIVWWLCTKPRASLKKDLCNVCNLVMTLPEIDIVEVTPYLNIGLQIVYRFAELFVGLVFTFG